MIVSIRHRGLRRFFENGDTRGLKRDQIKRLRRILTVLNSAAKVEDVGYLPGMRLHRLKGPLERYWSVSVSGNWRVIFRFEDGDVRDIDLIDYH